MTAPAPPAEFPYPVVVDDLPGGETRLTLCATEAQCAALAGRFGVLGIGPLEADLRLTPLAGAAGLVVRGRVGGRVRQACVVSLDPVDTEIDAGFEVRYRRDAGDGSIPDGELDLDPEDDAEPLIDGVVDLGELAAEQFALEIPAYPRAPGVAFGGYATEDRGEGPASVPAGPFSALAKLRENR